MEQAVLALVTFHYSEAFCEHNDCCQSYRFNNFFIFYWMVRWW